MMKLWISWFQMKQIRKTKIDAIACQTATTSNMISPLFTNLKRYNRQAIIKFKYLHIPNYIIGRMPKVL